MTPHHPAFSAFRDERLRDPDVRRAYEESQARGTAAMTQQQNPDGSWTPATPIGWREEHNRWQRFWLWVLRRPHCGRGAS